MRNLTPDSTLAALAEAIRQRSRRVVADVIEIGRDLSEAKAKLGHGKWLPWLRQEFGWSADTAGNFINIYKLSNTKKFRNVRNLPINLSALYSVARKGTPETVRAAIVKRAEAGEPISSRTVRLVKSEHIVPLNAPYQKVSEEPYAFPLAQRLEARDAIRESANQLIDLLCDRDVRPVVAELLTTERRHDLPAVQEAIAELNGLLAHGAGKSLACVK